MDTLSGLWAGEKRKQFADAKAGANDDAEGEISPRAAEICDSFLAGLYFLLTVRHLFGTRTLHDEAALRDLAWARAALDLNPYLAAAIITDIRKGRKALIEPAFLKPSRIERGKANGLGEDLRGRADVSQARDQGGGR
jgi:hypothetical protein